MSEMIRVLEEASKGGAEEKSSTLGRKTTRLGIAIDTLKDSMCIEKASAASTT